MSDNFGIGAFIIVLIIIVQSIVGSYFTYKNIRFFHQTGISLVLGIAASAIAYYGLDYQAKLQQETFIYIFLPAIIFSEGYSLKKKLFFKNMSYILIYGFLGTLITFTFLTISMEFLCDKNLIIVERGNTSFDDGDPIVGSPMELNTKEIILFSAALSSKDTFMATNMVNYEMYPTLFHIIFGEGIMNDATSLVLFQSFQAYVEDESDFSWNTLPHVLLNFMLSIVMCIVIGIFFGVLCTLILKHMKFINLTVIHEILIVFMCCYLGYCANLYINLSGIISLLFSGFVIGHYGFHNLSDKAKICANVTFQTISSGAENFLFAYVGFTTFSFYKNAWSFSLIGWVILIITISRIFQVFVISAIFKIFYRKSTFIVKFREQAVICFTGISRGILGFILMDQADSVYYQDLLNSTMVGVLIITTLLFGLINPKLIDCVLKDLKKQGGQENDKNIPTINNKQDQDVENQENKSQIIKNYTGKSMNEINLNQSTNQSNKIEQNIENFDQEEQNSEQENFAKKRQKIEALLSDTYNEKLFRSKLQFKFCKFNEKYIKTFLIRDYQSKLDEFIVANLMLKETKMQLIKPGNKSRNSIFIANSLQKLKSAINTSKFQNIQQQEIENQPELQIFKSVSKKDSKESKKFQQNPIQLEKINSSKKLSKQNSQTKKEQLSNCYVKLELNSQSQTVFNNACNEEILEVSEKSEQKE
ncbi:transporter/monovalent cation:proton antiporter-1 (CPA1) family protein (macronuclear) [Tetrahymena thermophila SB210]|uniref:Transporter/monovalent cation:proton antiporter-1 (CPA1) family protein n=1 Tax=Tetrahymena thermophila (strain SB210) TaxID=312017 RepID=Q24DC2_TETTS|nr:transporter/monovalent cation:proton antiporter-1 (CPA1) family protein [Tetrahymena thermophila SB210]EAS05783.2 transporter/monovalent cation:proton antiporter-1 (CPA1) family protein [Tetrahymena thermophila SB210]|eukprot:XP_001026028.2 transporter/monovalent cation:proton antiporter-1 (CPA1) family protein [Tetrahymena thermophila SB210]